MMVTLCLDLAALLRTSMASDFSMPSASTCSAISAKKGAPYLAALPEPTPVMRSNSSGVVG